MADWCNKKVIGLSPMDGVTDASFRTIIDKYGSPDVLFTEFLSVEAIVNGSINSLLPFVREKSETPTIAQVYGLDLPSYILATLLVLELGFDGIDINMGCPAKSIAYHGAGAGLIQNPSHAKQIIKTVQTTFLDWKNGLRLKSGQLKPAKFEWIKQNRIKRSKIDNFPVSIKTRIGYDTSTVQSWISHLLECEPYAITIHGRTLKQMYKDKSDWNEIHKAVVLAKNSNTKIIGNGDIKSAGQANNKIKKYDLDGVLIGRASMGNPWIFKSIVPTPYTRLTVALEHARQFEKLTPSGNFQSLRKHFAWYSKGFDYAASVRNKLMHVNTYSEVKTILDPYFLLLKEK